MRGALEHGLERAHALEGPFFLERIERGVRRSRGHGMSRVGVAVKQLHRGLGARHESVVDRGFNDHPAHGNDAVGDDLGEGDHVRNDAEALRAEGLTQAPEAGDHLVEDEQDAVLVADRTQPL